MHLFEFLIYVTVVFHKTNNCVLFVLACLAPMPPLFPPARKPFFCVQFLEKVAKRFYLVSLIKLKQIPSGTVLELWKGYE